MERSHDPHLARNPVVTSIPPPNQQRDSRAYPGSRRPMLGKSRAFKILPAHFLTTAMFLCNIYPSTMVRCRATCTITLTRIGKLINFGFGGKCAATKAFELYSPPHGCNTKLQGYGTRNDTKHSTRREQNVTLFSGQQILGD